MTFWTYATPAAVGFISSLISSNSASSASRSAAAAQLEGAKLSLDEQRRQFDLQMEEYRRKQEILEREYDTSKRELAPYVDAGQSALYEMMALTGLTAPKPQGFNTPQMQQRENTMAQATSDIWNNQFVGGSPGFDETRAATPYQTSVDTPASVLERDQGRRQMTPELMQRQQQQQVQAQAGQATAAQQATQATDEELMAQAEREWELNRKRAIRNMGLDPDLVPTDGDYTIGSGGFNIDAETMQPGFASTPEALYERLKEEQAAATQAPVEQGPPVPLEGPDPSPYAGMTGAEAQQQAIQRISDSPLMQELMRQGEEGILQNAAATGGLRGGNVQGALARYRPQFLQAEIDKQYSRLGGLSGAGQQSILRTPAAAVGGAPGFPTSDFSGVYNRMGDIGAASAIGQGQAQQDLFSGIGSSLGWLGYGYGKGWEDPQQQPQFPGTSRI